MQEHNIVLDKTVSDLILNDDPLDNYIEDIHSAIVNNKKWDNDNPEKEQAEAIARYFIEKGWSVNWNYSSNVTDIKELFRLILENLVFPIVITQTAVNPYVFKVSSKASSFIHPMYFPAILTRKIIKLLKSYGIKVIAEKRNRSLLDEDTIELCELALTGKSDINKPIWAKVAEYCKKIRTPKVNPWLTENTEIEESHDDPQLSEANLRFRGAEWFTSAQRDVSLIGCGGLGSNIAVSLCRVLGSNTLELYDRDRVEHLNLAGQNFGISDIGYSKAALVAGQCQNFNPYLSISIRVNFEVDDTLKPITITGLDNMMTRKLVFSKWQAGLSENSYDNREKLLIDARLNAEQWQIFCITGDNKKAQEKYKNKWLFSDEEATSEVCSYKQTAFAAQMCASFVTNLYINFCSNIIKQEDDPSKRYLPFLTEYDATQMNLIQTHIE